MEKTMDIKPTRKKFAIFMRFVLVISFVVAIFSAIYFYNQYKQATSEQVKAQKEIETIKNDLSKILIIPEEEPVIATVTDKAKLEQQAFFKQAENGDKVIIFKSTGKAILYRPSVNKIVDITVINIDEKPAETTQNTAPTTIPITITIYNGTETTGLAIKLQEEIVNVVKDIVVNSVAAAKNNYEKTQVIINNPNANQKAQELATFLNAEIQNLPSEEQNSNSDILIIVGNDKVD